jgi:hypothetical protein
MNPEDEATLPPKFPVAAIFVDLAAIFVASNEFGF